MTQDDKPILTTMLYKHPGKHKIHGDMFDYIIVNDDDVDANLKKGWHKSTPDALKGEKKTKTKSKKKE
jgi:hypothetical protein